MSIISRGLTAPRLDSPVLALVGRCDSGVSDVWSKMLLRCSGTQVADAVADETPLSAQALEAWPWLAQRVHGGHRTRWSQEQTSILVWLEHITPTVGTQPFFMTMPHLHPIDAKALISEIYRLAQASEGHVVLRVNCPVALDAMQSLDHVICVCRDARGVPRWKRLSEHPDASKWQDKMRVGEFWSVVGEEWVVAPKAAP